MSVTKSQNIGKATVIMIAAEIVRQIMAGSRDPMVLIPWESLIGFDNAQQAVTRAMTAKRDDYWGYWDGLSEAEAIIKRSNVRKDVSGLVKSLGWRASNRKVSAGIEFRPGLAFILATLGRMPEHDIVTRVAQQGPNTKSPTLTVWNRRAKDMVTVK